MRVEELVEVAELVRVLVDEAVDVPVRVLLLVLDEVRVDELVEELVRVLLLEAVLVPEELDDADELEEDVEVEVEVCVCVRVDVWLDVEDDVRVDV